MGHTAADDLAHVVSRLAASAARDRLGYAPAANSTHTGKAATLGMSRVVVHVVPPRRHVDGRVLTRTHHDRLGKMLIDVTGVTPKTMGSELDFDPF